jgi:Uma2 family endonuclease
VCEYWIVNPTERSIQVFVRNEAGVFIGLRPLVEDDSISTDIIPGLEISLMDAFFQ